MNKIIIAIDGYSSTGKSTLAKELAKEIDYIYIDTGAMYRAIALFAIQKQYITQDHFDKQALIEALKEIKISFKSQKNSFGTICLNGINVEKEIRSLEVSNFVSIIAAVSEVRSKLVQQQQEMGKLKGIVMDGRDIGTVVFPDAELKIFMTASPAIRAMRRYNEMIKKGQNVTFEEILENVQKRDWIDTTREDSPLKKAADAIEIDNSELSKTEQYNKVLSIFKNITNESKFKSTNINI